MTGAGFGVTATESVVVRLCEGRPAPARVRVDMVPSLAMEAGTIGEALAGTILEGLPGVDGGGRYAGAPLLRAGGWRRPGWAATRLASPCRTARRSRPRACRSASSIAAQRASGAPSVIAASSEAPSSPVVRVLLPLVTALLAIGPVRAFAMRRLAAGEAQGARAAARALLGARPAWSGPTAPSREGWLRVGEAQAYTGAVPAEVARRLLAGEGRPGACTPAALFGSSLAEAAAASTSSRTGPVSSGRGRPDRSAA